MIWLTNSKRLKRWIIINLSLCFILTFLLGCQAQVSNDQLDKWYKEAIAENARLTDLHGSNLSENWILRVQGQVQKPITLKWAEIEALADTKFISINPHPGAITTPQEFQGISVQKLLEKAIINSGVEELTVVAADAYYTTIAIKDVYRNQGLLTILEAGKRIRRNEGGPIHLAYFRDANSPQGEIDKQRWVHYVTHLIVGTEPLRLRVEKATLELADLEKLPTHKITTLVGYQIGWKYEPVDLIGVKLRDILRSQNVVMNNESVLRVRRKSMDDLDPQKSVKIPASLVNDCDVMLVYKWGTDAQSIPASKGGPITLAYGNNCPSETVKNLAWLPFVESISVESAEIKS
jgi:DMSO/TMAO reductase YedYZ molybdopterin-dependent catalytic subunit